MGGGGGVRGRFCLSLQGYFGILSYYCISFDQGFSATVPTRNGEGSKGFRALLS